MAVFAGILQRQSTHRQLQAADRALHVHRRPVRRDGAWAHPAASYIGRVHGRCQARPTASWPVARWHTR
jgi:hypothetical protein